ncbi:hypothetical protein G3O00_38385 [Burkholderia sp. Ac-20384]|uniref:hypothetical protein n=1 Tax=Burkholderia sp. Ac-20384 TaxID=2703902 RepID=UPI00197DCD43|nr:hypothetical protein [Burkholderia sp. Ac-20384]MBN3829427.1 hypothetical protein [Burkholderia sp. Ac-20384]
MRIDFFGKSRDVNKSTNDESDNPWPTGIKAAQAQGRLRRLPEIFSGITKRIPSNPASVPSENGAPASRARAILPTVLTPHPEDLSDIGRALYPKHTVSLDEVTSAMAVTSDVSPVGEAVSVNPESTEIPATKYEATHERYGNLTIQQAKKSRQSKLISYNLVLRFRGDIYEYRKDMIVDSADTEYGGRSTLGYSDIYLPEKMQNKGVGYMLHYALAEAGLAAGTDLIVVSSVVSDAMRRLCEQVGMKEDGVGWGSYSGRPAEVAQLAAKRARAKGWELP